MKIVSVVSRLSLIASVWLTVFDGKYWYSILYFLIVVFVLEIMPYNIQDIKKPNAR